MRLSGILAMSAMLVGGFALATPATAAIYDYNFGTSTGTYNTAAATVLADPAAPQGTARVRIGTGAGSFTFVNPGSTLGSGSELQCVAPTGGSVNKFSVSDYPADKSFHTRFNLRLQGGSSGT